MSRGISVAQKISYRPECLIFYYNLCFFLLQTIVCFIAANSVNGKLVEVGYIPASLANPKDVSTNFKQCNQIAFPPEGTTSDITDLGDLSDKDLTKKPIFFSGYGFTKLDT